MNKKLILIGPKSSLLTTSGQAMMFQLLIDEISNNNFDFLIIDISEKESFRKSGSFSFKRLTQYLKLFLKYLFFLIRFPREIIYITISQSLPGFLRDFFFISFGRLFNLKIIAHQFGGNFYNFYYNQPLFVRHLIKYLYLKVDQIVVEGEFSKNNFKFLDNSFRNITIIPNGLPERNLANVYPKEYSLKCEFNLLYLSNLILSKGYLDVLEAVNLLVNKFKINVKCSFVGSFVLSNDDPPNTTIQMCKNYFFNYIHANCLENHVSYSESKYGIAKQEEFLKSNVFILPSYYLNEGQPVSVLEAISYGVVPILTKYRLMPQMITVDSGLFVEPKNPDSIVQNILFLINNPDIYKKYSSNSIQHFNNNFTSQIYLNKILNLFNCE
jgi:glycosyltransferase involved in cell wall biosynthesis